MTIRLAPAIAVLAALFSGAQVHAKDKTDPTAPPASRAGLTPLARKYALKREALLKEVAAKRRSLVESAEWKSQSAEQRRIALEAIVSEAKSRDDKLTAEYDAERRRQRQREDADEAAARESQRRALDAIQVQAAQDARRAKPTP